MLAPMREGQRRPGFDDVVPPESQKSRSRAPHGRLVRLAESSRILPFRSEIQSIRYRTDDAARSRKRFKDVRRVLGRNTFPIVTYGNQCVMSSRNNCRLAVDVVVFQTNI